MRLPKYLSHSSLSLWEKDREEFYIRHLANNRAPRLPQEAFMSIGSAFDAYAKSALYERLFGKGTNPQFDFDAIFTSQVEAHNRDWARENGLYVYQCYVHTGAFDELLALLVKSQTQPRFEFSIEGTITGTVNLGNGPEDVAVPFLGKPDCQFIHQCGVHVVLDWKVKGFCSKYGASPSKGYALCRDGYDAIRLGIDKTKACPEGKQSKSHNSEHGGYLAYDHKGMTINAGYMEDCNAEYADQLSVYGWLLGEKVGDEEVVLAIDEIVSKYRDDQLPLLRVANHRARVRGSYQNLLLARAHVCWKAITGGHVFTDMSLEESQGRCEMLEEMAIGLQSSGSTLDNWFNEVVRPGFRK